MNERKALAELVACVEASVPVARIPGYRWHDALNAAREALAQPEPEPDVRISDDDALRFACRVLDSGSSPPEADRQAARDGLMEIRTRIRAQPAPPPPAAQPVQWAQHAEHWPVAATSTLDRLPAAPPPPAQPEPEPTLSPSEAVYAFAGWLTCRDEAVTFGSTHNAAIAADLVNAFCESQHLKPPRHEWSDAIKPYPWPAAPPPPAQPLPDPRAFNTAEKCSPMLTQCPRCNNPHNVCDGGAQAALAALTCAESHKQPFIHSVVAQILLRDALARTGGKA